MSHTSPPLSLLWLYFITIKRKSKEVWRIFYHARTSFSFLTCASRLFTNKNAQTIGPRIPNNTYFLTSYRDPFLRGIARERRCRSSWPCPEVCWQACQPKHSPMYSDERPAGSWYSYFHRYSSWPYLRSGYSAYQVRAFPAVGNELISGLDSAIFIPTTAVT